MVGHFKSLYHINNITKPWPVYIGLTEVFHIFINALLLFPWCGILGMLIARVALACILLGTFFVFAHQVGQM